MIVTTSPFVAGYRVAETKGQVFGLVVRSRGLAGNFAAGLDRMVQNATLMGANAVISMRFDSSEIGTSMSEIVAYGTAVVLAADAGAPQATAE